MSKRIRPALLRFLRTPRDHHARFELMVALGNWLTPSYRFKWAQMRWWEDTAFSAYLARFQEQDGFNSDRRWMVYQLVRLTAEIPGDTAECGVYRGAGSYLICQANIQSQQPRHHHAFDSFEGLSQPAEVDGSHWHSGDLACGLRDVRRNLSEFSHVTYYRGWIPDRFAEAATKAFSFVHVDVDLYQPTRDSIEFFYPRLSPGAILVCDDYGFTSCPGATKAVDDYLADKPESMLALCGGGGFLVKGCVTAAESLKAA